MSQAKFPELPVEVQVALINAASSMAAAKISGIYIKDSVNSKYDFFKIEYERICDALYKENRGRQ
ncbi:hypothetical protein [Pantoea dispersa]|uniref:hypothetical protein n=1 Tax=Pantoea dispersa TaxID=59814 RepID=UPI0024AFA53E|nr:hypothetical protein [Pantoea dispersa]MDI6634341.1 hypothetical protein [Pantoea dispersa]